LKSAFFSASRIRLRTRTASGFTGTSTVGFRGRITPSFVNATAGTRKWMCG
jgi:hypothetical protein